jgi:Ca2+/Na+ antiporter
MIPLFASWPAQTFYILYVIVAVAGIVAVLYRYRKNRRAIKGLLLVMFPVVVAGFALATFLFAPVFGRRAAWIITAYLMVTCFAVIGILRYRGDLRALTPSANWFAGILMALYCGVVLFNRTPVPDVEVLPMEISAGAKDTGQIAETAPDIYLIALDGYARADTLRSEFGFNNMAFENQLRDAGFTIAPESHSNYPVHTFALAACLNLDYLDTLVGPSGGSQGNVDNVLSLFHRSRVANFLRTQGYEVVGFSPGFQSLEPLKPDVDIRIEPPRTLGEFEMVLAGRTVASRVMEGVYYLRYRNPAYWRFSFRRTRILHTMQELVRQCSEQRENPRFFFANLLIPEPPFLFDRDGNRAQPFGPGSLAVHRGPQGETMALREAYLDQVFYTNQILAKTVQRIVTESKRPAVVLIASSRGAPLSLQPAGAAPENRYANFVAVRFPDSSDPDQGPIYPSISLVNLFRVTFNQVFQTGLPLVEDRMMRVDDEHPFEPNPLRE